MAAASPTDEMIAPPKKINMVIEYRLPMPCTLEEYRRAQLYGTAKSSWQTTLLSTGSGGNAGVVVLRNEPKEGLHPNVVTHGRYPDREKYTSSQHTVKHIHFGKSLPKVVSAILPKDAKYVEERCWNSFPYVITLYTSKQSFLSSRLYISVESVHIEEDVGDQENVFNLSGKELEQRKVIRMDIANDWVNPEDASDSSPAASPVVGSPASPTPGKKGKEPQIPVGDPRVYQSKLTGRGPLNTPEWHKETKPIMTAYKLVRLTCDVPFHDRVERAVLKAAIYDMVLNTHKNIFCSMDEWLWLDHECIRQFEKAAFEAASAALQGDRGPAEALQLPTPPTEAPEWATGPTRGLAPSAPSPADDKKEEKEDDKEEKDTKDE